MGGVAPIFILILRLINSNSNKTARSLAWFLRIFPAYCFGEGLVNICSIPFYSKVQENIELEYFSLEISLAPIIYLACTSCLFPFLIYLI